MVTDVVGGARTYAIKGYRPLMFAVLAVNTLMFGTVAVLLIGRNIGLALALAILYAVMVSVGLRSAPHGGSFDCLRSRSGRGLDLRSIPPVVGRDQAYSPSALAIRSHAY